MNTSQDTSVAGLEHLLAALRAAGLPVGAQEILRLHHVFSLAPGLRQDRPPKDQLQDLLASALTHDLSQRRLFDEVYGPWSQRWDGCAHQPSRATARAPTGPETDHRSTRQAKKQPSRSGLVLAQLLVLALLAIQLTEHRRPETGSALEETNTSAFDLGTAEAAHLEPKPVHTIWLPRLTVIDEGGSEWRPTWPPLALASLALIVAGLLAWRYRRRQWIPSLLREPLPGPPKLPLLPLASTGPELVNAGGADTLVWGVDRHLSEGLTSEIDLEDTAHETASAGGLPTLRFEPERRLREVWIWLDVLVDDRALERWAEEITASLERSGLPARIGSFSGLPDELEWDEGHFLRPTEVETHRETALVAICTDGEMLLHQLEEDPSLVRPLLASLAAWQRLAIVDFSTRPFLLRKTLASFGLALVKPEDLPAYFGLGRERPEESIAVDPGEIRAWRAALALGGRPVDRRTAFAARRALDLEVSPWVYHLVVDGGAEDPARPFVLGGRLSWNEDARTALVSWLAEGSLDATSGIRQGSLLEKSLDFWQTRLATESERRTERTAIEPWKERPAERHLQMERALLRLWREPQSAAEELYELGVGELAERLRSHLQRQAPRDCCRPGDGLIPLPWRLTDLNDRYRYLLAERGLGGIQRGTLASSGRLGLGLGTLVGLALLLLILGSIGRREVVGISPKFELVGAQPSHSDIAIDVLQLADRWRISAQTTSGHQTIKEVGDGAIVEVSWETMKFVELKGDTFRMGTEMNDPWARPPDTLRDRTNTLPEGTTAGFNEEDLQRDQPAHDVTVGDFWISQFEVTNAQYRLLDTTYPDNKLPATGVSWTQARGFCQDLGDKFDLPTEAQWEYASRAGSSTPWSFGSSPKDIDTYAWYRGNSKFRVHRVGTKKPNLWGVYDTHGNVWEWTLDCWADDYRERVRAFPTTDPGMSDQACLDSTESRTLRGGSFNLGLWSLRSAYRNSEKPEHRSLIIGFRCIFQNQER